jgi:ATPase family associated with various cellular activities (AAA)
MSLITSTEREPALLDLPATPRSHFKLGLIASALRVREVLETERTASEFPFLESYAEEAAMLCGAEPGPGLVTRFRQEVARWATAHEAVLPLSALASGTNLSADALDLLLTIGLIEEDPRFGPLFEWAQPGSPGQQRPTLGLLTAWWRDEEDCVGIRSALRRLSELGLISVVNRDAPRLFWAYEATPILWDVLRGETDLSGATWLSFRNGMEMAGLQQFILPSELQAKVRAMPKMLAAGQLSAIIVRGPLHNGRKTMLRALARSAGYSVLEVEPGHKLDGAKPAWLGTLCILLHAIPLFTVELAPGENAAIPFLGCYHGPQAIALSRYGSIEGKLTECAIALELPLPHWADRRRLWARALGISEEHLPEWADRLRLTSGGIHRAAELARREALLEGARELDHHHVRRGMRALQQPLENQARRIEADAAWEHIVAAPDVLAELHTLAERCRYREQLAAALGPVSSSHGVKALFGGPSGTGKTLAARVLASELQLDLYRLDLSAVVNKYIGETEKNLNQVLSRAEELNIILLLDEGDSLLTARTAVQSSNDRYANLETNFLLQRIESYEGILFITTNALHRIDAAFQRRMDVLIDFRMPDAEERRQIWRLHLPPDHEVAEHWIDDAARRCPLSGGQIRNAALHASLLALGRGSRVRTGDVADSVFREYQKIGAVCPLRRPGGA